MINDFVAVVVDDDKDILEFYVNILASHNVKSITFERPEDLPLFILENKKKVAIIISDLNMPNMTGLQLKEKLNEIAPEIPFGIVTGYWDKELVEKSLDLGVKFSVEKPLELEQFITEAIEKYAIPRVEALTEEKEMIEGFLEESMPMLEEIEGLILELEENPESQDSLAIYFRLLHTIKGTASCVGLTKLGEFTHHYEDFIGELRNGKIKVSTKSTNILLAGLDRLKVFFNDCIQHYSDEKIDVHSEILLFSSFIQNDDSTEDLSFSSVDRPIEKVVKSEKKKESDKISVGMDLLDSFMEENGELTVVRNSIIKTVKRIEGRLRGDKDLEALNDLLEGMYDITSNIQNKIIEMRKVSLKTVFRPFKRLVRDISKALGKEIELVINGDDLYVDNVIAKLYSNTLIHLIRNSLDHGIETTVERLQNGKIAQGTLTINVEERGELISLEIIDDGKGIDPAIIANKSIEKGLFTQSQIDKMRKSEILDIIFHSGFSTAQVVSDISGRGVGMDMVRGSFEEFGGNIKIDSDVGKGTRFNLIVPIPKSVLIINSLQVETAGQLFLFSMDEVSEVLRVTGSTKRTQINQINGTYFLRHNNSFYELCFLKDLVKEDKNHDNFEELNIVILKHKNTYFGVVVDQIYEFEEVVMRKLCQQIDNVSLYQGAALLGSGEVSLIFSANGIMDKVGIKQKINKKLLEDEIDMVINQKEYILFENSEKLVLSVELEHVYRFEKIKAKHISFTGNNRIVNYFGEVLPLVDPFFVAGLNNENFLDLTKDEQLNVIVLQNDHTKVGLVVNKIGDLISTNDQINTDTIDIESLRGSYFYNGHTICVINEDFILNKANWNNDLFKTEDESIVFEFPKAA